MNNQNFIANGFTFEMPDNWRDRSMITIVEGAEGEGFAANVIVMRQQVSSDISIEEYARQQLTLTRDAMPDLVVLDERRTRIGNHPAVQRLQSVVADGRQLQQAQTFILVDTTIFAVTCTASPEDFLTAGASFRRVMDSFRFFDPTRVSIP